MAEFIAKVMSDNGNLKVNVGKQTNMNENLMRTLAEVAMEKEHLVTKVEDRTPQNEV